MVAADFFSANATVYDERDRPFLSDEAALRLATVAGLGANARVLDVGAGTGRVAIPLARIGCDVLAMDSAEAMLAVMAGKTLAVPLKRAVADATRLPFLSEQFDAVVLARLLCLIPDWRDVLRETVRVMKYGGRVLHEWGNGDQSEDWVRVREYARVVFEQAGVTNPFHPGARSEDDVDGVLTSEGLRHVSTLELGPGPPMTLAAFLAGIGSGRFSYTWNVPSAVLPGCLRRLNEWAVASFDLTLVMPIPREQTWRIYA